MAAAASTHTAAPPAAAPPEADPAHEVFDLVDDAGAIVGQESRSVCHKLGLLHRAGASPPRTCLVGAPIHGPTLTTSVPLRSVCVFV